jgi:hypothetical protein
VFSGKLTFHVECDDGSVIEGTGHVSGAEMYHEYIESGQVLKPIRVNTNMDMRIENPEFRIYRIPRECWVTGEWV